jgi:hypothetical protein
LGRWMLLEKSNFWITGDLEGLPAKRNREILLACQNVLLYTNNYFILKLYYNVICCIISLLLIKAQTWFDFTPSMQSNLTAYLSRTQQNAPLFFYKNAPLIPLINTILIALINAFPYMNAPLFALLLCGRCQTLPIHAERDAKHHHCPSF